MRKKGMSYSQIKDALGLSKSTMSNWLSSMPLTKEQISGLRDKNPQRIERYRTTMRNKKIARQDAVLKKAQEDIGTLADRELFFAGLALYWGEGTKAQPATVALTNNNPSNFFSDFFSPFATMHPLLIRSISLFHLFPSNLNFQFYSIRKRSFGLPVIAQLF